MALLFALRARRDSFPASGNGRRCKLKDTAKTDLKDGDYCEVVGGTHRGKTGTVKDVKTSKTGHVTITVVEDSGERFKTLAKNVSVRRRRV